MKQIRALLLLVLFLMPAAAGWGQEYRLPFYPQYWITGTVAPAEDGTSAEGRTVYFYKSDAEYNTGRYSFDLVGAGGAARRAGRYMVNVFGLGLDALGVGQTYYVGIPNSNPESSAEGYGAGPVPVIISGAGFDEAPLLTLAKGTGPVPPPPPGREFAPTIRVWFGRRLYQPGVYGRKDEGKRQFVVEPTGKLKIEVSIPEPFELNESASYAMRVQTPQGDVHAHSLSRVPDVFTTAAGVKPLVIEASFPEELTPVGDESVYTLTFFASSRGNLGAATATATQCAVTVLSGPARLVDIPLTVPSPVSLRADREVFLQYTLSRDAAIDIYIVDIAARVVKKLGFAAGQEGGTAGINKVSWDLQTDQGVIASSGIYVFSLVDRESGKLLGKGKLTAIP